MSARLRASHIFTLAGLALVGLVLAAAVGDVLADATRPRTPPTRSPFEPRQRKDISAVRNDVRVRVLDRRECTDCGGSYFQYSWSLEVNLRGTRQQLTVIGPAQIDDIRVVDNDRAILLGQLQSSVGAVVLFSFKTGVLLDKFLAFDPEMSPNGRWIACTKAYPVHFVEGVSDQYVVYDTALAPSAHRHATVARDDEINVGIPIYPAESQNLPGDNTSVPETLRHKRSSATFFWSPDGDRVVFGDWHRGSGSLVSVDLSLGAAQPLVAVHPISTEALIDRDRCQDFRGREAYAATIADVQFIGVEAFRVRFAFQQSCGKLDTLIIR